MSRGSVLLRWAIGLHRWLGIPMSVFFALWFVSGAVMLFVPFPSLPDVDRLGASPQIDGSSIAISPLEALAVAGRDGGVAQVGGIRLLGRREQGPIYVVSGTTSEGADQLAAIDATTGRLVPALVAAQARDIAADFFELAGPGPKAATVSGPLDYDQWVVHEKFDDFRPFFKATFLDQASTVLYISAQTGEVLQRTSASQRFWNLPGSVVHWIYPTLIRRDWALWDALVWWLSLVALAVAGLGIVLGLVRLRNKSGVAAPTRFTPYKGWMRWHHLLGLSGGLVVLTWIFSGWLSMDHGRLFATPDPEPHQRSEYYGGSLDRAVTGINAASLAGLSGSAELEFLVFDGDGLIVSRSANQRSVLRVASAGGRLEEAAPSMKSAKKAIARAWSGAIVEGAVELRAGDRYGHLLEGHLPASTVRFVVSDPAATWVHVDRETGQIINVMNRSRRTYRWLYNGLHSFDLPGLSARPVVRKTIMLLLLALGFALSLTSLFVAWRSLQRHWRGLLARSSGAR